MGAYACHFLTAPMSVNALAHIMGRSVSFLTPAQRCRVTTKDTASVMDTNYSKLQFDVLDRNFHVYKGSKFVNLEFNFTLMQ